MKHIEDDVDISTGEPQLAEGSAPTDNNTTAAAAAAAAAAVVRESRYGRMERHARALRLSRELRMRISVDATGFLNDKIAIVYQLRHRRTIRPFFVRVGHLAPDIALSGEHGVLARVRRYNAALERLHQLADQLATNVRTGRVALARDSKQADAYDELSGLNKLVASRQAQYMGYSVVHLDRLGAEITFFEGCIARLAPIAEMAEPAASALPRLPTEPQSTAAPLARRWRDWPHWIWRTHRDDRHSISQENLKRVITTSQGSWDGDTKPMSSDEDD
jgi:hypothetical protein